MIKPITKNNVKTTMKEFKINNEKNIGTGFKVPENYFTEFSEKVKLKINDPEPKVISIFQKRKTWFSFVAAILIISLFVSIYTEIVVKPTDEKLTLENYITNQSEISQYDLVALLDSKDIEKIKIDLIVDDNKIEEELTNSNEIEIYLTE
jgi:hypothetical protein